MHTSPHGAPHALARAGKRVGHVRTAQRSGAAAAGILMREAGRAIRGGSARTSSARGALAVARGRRLLLQVALVVLGHPIGRAAACVPAIRSLRLRRLRHQLDRRLCHLEI